MTVWEGIIVAFLSSLITLVLGLLIEYRTGWFAARQRKGLSYEIESFARLISVNDDSGEIEVFYRGEPIKNLWSFVIKIVNTGKATIIPDDYVRPIVINPKGRGIQYQIVETTPRDLLPEFERVEDSEMGYFSSLRMSKLMLNSGDSLTLSLLVSDYRGGLEISGRVAGVKEIQDGLRAKTNNLMWGAMAIFIVSVIFLFFMVLDLFGSTAASILAIVGVVMMVIMFFFVFSIKKR